MNSHIRLTRHRAQSRTTDSPIHLFNQKHKFAPMINPSVRAQSRTTV